MGGSAGAADEAAGELTGRLVVGHGLHPVDERRDVATAVLHEPSPSGRQVERHARRVEAQGVEVDEDGITSGDPEDEPASVDIHLGDRVLSRAVRGGKGSLAVPMSETELTHKYRHLAGPVLGAGLAAVLEQRVLGLRDDPDVSGLPTSLAQR